MHHFARAGRERARLCRFHQPGDRLEPRRRCEPEINVYGFHRREKPRCRFWLSIDGHLARNREQGAGQELGRDVLRRAPTNNVFRSGNTRGRTHPGFPPMSPRGSQAIFTTADRKVPDLFLFAARRRNGGRSSHQMQQPVAGTLNAKLAAMKPPKRFRGAVTLGI